MIRYHKTHGHFKVPIDNRNKNNPENPLGHWVSNQRRCHKAGTLRDDRKALLNNINFVWDAEEEMDQNWRAYLDALKEILAQKRTSAVQTSLFTLSTLGRRVYNWVHKQRLLYLKGTLDPQRKAMLDKLGVDWTEWASEEGSGDIIGSD